jgi:hypothetical protein
LIGDFELWHCYFGSRQSHFLSDPRLPLRDSLGAHPSDISSRDELVLALWVMNKGLAKQNGAADLEEERRRRQQVIHKLRRAQRGVGKRWRERLDVRLDSPLHFEPADARIGEASEVDR